MNKLEEIFDFDIKPELPTEVGTDYQASAMDLAIKNIYSQYKKIYPWTFGIAPTDYSTGFGSWAPDRATADCNPYWYKNNGKLTRMDAWENSVRNCACVPFMFKLAIPDEWLADLECDSDFQIMKKDYAKTNKFYFPFFNYPGKLFTRMVEDVFLIGLGGHSLLKTGKKYDGLDEYQISDTPYKVVYDGRRKEYFLVQRVPFCKVGNYFISPILSREMVSEENVYKKMQEVWNEAFDKQEFLKRIKTQLFKSFKEHYLVSILQKEEVKKLSLVSLGSRVIEGRFIYATNLGDKNAREISDYALLTGGLGLVNMGEEDYEDYRNWVAHKGTTECSYLTEWNHLNANWDLGSADYLGAIGTIEFMKNFDFSFLGIRMGFYFDSLEKTFTKVKGSIGWLKEESPQSILNDGYQELFEKAYQNDLLEKTDTYFTNPKTKEKQSVYHAFGIKAIRVTPSFYRTDDFCYHFSNGNTYRGSYEKPTWVRVEPIECLIKGNYAEFKKILIAGLPIKFDEEVLNKIKTDLNVYSIPRENYPIANSKEIADFINNVFAKEISNVLKAVPYNELHPKEIVDSYDYTSQKEYFPEEKPYSLELHRKKIKVNDYLNDKRRWK